MRDEATALLAPVEPHRILLRREEEQPLFHRGVTRLTGGGNQFIEAEPVDGAEEVRKDPRRSMEMLLEQMEKYSDNEQFIKSFGSRPRR